MRRARLTSDVTGAPEGALLEGVGNTTRGALVRLERGTLLPEWSEARRLYAQDPAGLLRKLRATPFLRDKADAWLVESFRLGSGVAPRDARRRALAGDGLVATLLAPGPLAAFAEEEGRLGELEALIGVPQVSAEPILRCLGKHSLSLHPPFFAVTEGLDRLPAGSGLPRVALDSGGDLYLVPGGRWCIQAHPGPARTPEACLSEAGSALGCLPELEAARAVTAAYPTPGALKSLLQKAIRSGATRWAGASGAHVALAAFCTLLASPGQFNPETQVFVRGVTAAAKRLAVVIAEDAWVDGGEAAVARLLAGAYLAAREPGWFPSGAALADWARLCLRAHASTAALGFPAGPSPAVTDGTAGGAAAASWLLDQLRSFPGDLELFRALAAGRALPRPAPLPRPEQAPLEHAVDQHWAPDVALYFDGAAPPAPRADPSRPFAGLFAALFARVTGTNFRRGSAPEPGLFLDAARRAQRRALEIRRPAPPAEGGGPATVEVSLDLPPGWLAAMLGPVPVAASVAAVLCPADPGSVRACPLPSRAAKDFRAVAVAHEARARAAVARLRGRGLAAAAPPAPRFRGATLTWAEAGPVLTLPSGGRGDWAALARQPEVFRAGDPPEAPSLDAALALRGAEWVSPGLLARAAGLAAAAPAGARRRLRSFCRAPAGAVRFPRIARDGGRASDGLAPRASDPGAFALLASLSCLAPGIVRLAGPGAFEVRAPAFLPRLAALLAQGAPGRPAAAAPWAALRIEGRAPLRHQREACDALAAAAERGLRGHFVFQDVGCGKTFTLLMFLARLRDRGEAPPCCVWAAPRETLQSLAAEIGRFAPVAAFDGVVRPGVVLLVELLHGLRRAGVREALLRAAPETLLVVDEVHRAYNPTLRTSVALEVAAEAARVVAMTGTPAIDARMEKLARWLALCADYEVTARSWLVAAAEMVAHHLELGIEVRREDLWVDWPGGAPAAYLAAVADRRWGAAAEAAWDAADPALAREAVRLAGERGALLVARDAAHRRRLAALVGALGAEACTVEADDGRARLVLAVKTQCHGYNHLVRLGALVSGPYPSNAAERAQMLGRIRRLGQTAKSLVHCRVAVRGSLVQLLAERHDEGGAAHLTIEALARLLAPDELRRLGEAAGGAKDMAPTGGGENTASTGGAEGAAGPRLAASENLVADDDPAWAEIGW